MGNINAPKIEYFESFASEIQSKFQRVKNLVDHTVSSGDYHEEIIRTVLRNFLTKRYSVKKGFIYKGEGEVSRQIDILIIDENAPAAYLFQEGDFAIVLPTAVIAVLEVKTTLTKPEFKLAVENLASAKRLMEFPITLPAIIFGYQGTIPSDENLDTWFRETPLPEDREELAPTVMMFSEAGKLLTPCSEDGSFQLSGKHYYKIFRSDDTKVNNNDLGWQLSVMLAIIITACEGKENARTRSLATGYGGQLIQSQGAQKSHERFTFGHGMSELENEPFGSIKEG